MSFESFVLWLSVMFPLLMTPGPANITVSSLAARYGMSSSLRFILGISLWNLIVAFALGLSFSFIHEKYDLLFHVIELFGSFYILFLAYKIYKSATKKIGEEKIDKKPSFFSGFLMQILNGKLYSVLILMFSQFLDSHGSIYKEAALLTLFFVLLCFGVYVFWGALGLKMSQVLGPKGQALQLKISAFILAVLGLLMVRNNPLF